MGGCGRTGCGQRLLTVQERLTQGGKAFLFHNDDGNNKNMSVEEQRVAGHRSTLEEQQGQDKQHQLQ